RSPGCEFRSIPSGNRANAGHVKRDPGRAATSGPNSVLQRFSGRHHFAAVVVPAMGADMMRALQFAAIGAFRVGLMAESLMAASHSPARGRRFTFRDSHGTWSSSGLARREASK